YEMNFMEDMNLSITNIMFTDGNSDDFKHNIYHFLAIGNLNMVDTHANLGEPQQAEEWFLGMLSNLGILRDDAQGRRAKASTSSSCIAVAYESTWHASRLACP
ncbi:hypothetical protein ACJX0J_034494, partial [Zea mays]